MSLNSFPFLSIERQEGIRRSGGSQSSAAGGRCDARRLGRLRHQWQSRLAAVRSEAKGDDAIRYNLEAGRRSMRCGACAVGGSTLAFVRIDRNGRSLMVTTDTASTETRERGRSLPTQAERFAAGKALRKKAPRSSHGEWTPDPERPDPLSILEESNRGRILVAKSSRCNRGIQAVGTLLR